MKVISVHPEKRTVMAESHYMEIHSIVVETCFFGDKSRSVKLMVVFNEKSVDHQSH